MRTSAGNGNFREILFPERKTVWYTVYSIEPLAERMTGLDSFGEKKLFRGKGKMPLFSMLCGTVDGGKRDAYTE